MSSHKKVAILTGVLYVIATIAGVSSLGFLAVFDDPDVLTKAAAEASGPYIGLTLFFIMTVTVTAIAVALYPVLKKTDEMLAVGYVCARLVEGIFFFVQIVALLTLLTLSQSFVAAGAPDDAHFQTARDLLASVGHWSGDVVAGLIFALSALIINYLLYRFKLVPRWLSGWGLLGTIVYPAAALSLLGPEASGYLYGPLALQEMVFAVWLLVKGFNPEAVAAIEADA